MDLFFGAPVALALGLPFIPVRKPGKLPREVIAQSYQLEYGQDTLDCTQMPFHKVIMC